MCIKTELTLLVTNKTFDDFAHLYGAVRRVVGTDVFFDEFGPVENGIVHIKRRPVGDDWSCDLQAKVLSS